MTDRRGTSGHRQFGPRPDPRSGSRSGPGAGRRPGPPDAEAPARRAAVRPGPDDRGQVSPAGSWPEFHAAPLAAERTGPRVISARAEPAPPRGGRQPHGGYQPDRAGGGPDNNEPAASRTISARAGAGTLVPQPPRAASRVEAAGSRSVRARSTGRAGRSPGRRRRTWLLVCAGAGGVAAIAVAAMVLLRLLGPSGPAHVLTTPSTLGQYVRRPQLEQQMNAAALRQQVIARSAGQASHVQSAVYENSAGVSGKASPQIFLFIGGNLSGTSAAAFINGFRSQFRGAVLTSAGSMGGDAVCVNAQSGVPGTVALCAWADNDTFGVLASPTMHAPQLGAQMRLIRPGVEHVAK